MSELQKERRSRRIDIGPFDTFVKQVQNIATLFPRMSEDEQHEAVTILKQFTSVISVRFGPDDDQKIRSSSVVIVPLSPDPDVSVPGAENELTVEPRKQPIHDEVHTETTNAVQYVLGSSPGVTHDEYCNLMITDPDGHEQMVLIKNKDLHLDDHGQILLSHNPQHQISSILSGLTSDIGNSLDDPPSADDGEITPKKWKFNKTEDENHGLVIQNQVELEENIPSTEDAPPGGDSGTNDDQLMSSSLSPGFDVNEITVIEGMLSENLQDELVNSDPDTSVLGDKIPRSLKVNSRSVKAAVNPGIISGSEDTHSTENNVKRKRGRPKGTFRGRKPIQKGTCDVCGKTLNNASNLSVHMRIHTGDRPYKCQYCDDAFTTFGNRRRHEAAHLGEKSHICEVCGRGFLEKKSLVMHMRTHTGEKPHSCDICGQNFRQLSSLRMHRAKHTGIRNYRCTKCNKSFIQKSGLNHHMKRHDEGKTIPCPECNKIFYTEELMMKHREHHTRSRPFKCVLCSTAVASKTLLLDHMNLYHGEGGRKLFNCLPCGKIYPSRLGLREHFTSAGHRNRVRRDNASDDLFPSGAQLEEIHEIDLQELPVVKQEVLFALDVDEDADTGLYTVTFDTPNSQKSLTKSIKEEPISDLPTVVHRDSLPESVANKLSGLMEMQNLILSDKNKRIIVLKDIPGKRKQRKS